MKNKWLAITERLISTIESSNPGLRFLLQVQHSCDQRRQESELNDLNSWTRANMDQDKNAAADKLEPSALCESTSKDQETVKKRTSRRKKIPTAKGKEYSLGLLK